MIYKGIKYIMDKWANKAARKNLLPFFENELQQLSENSIVVSVGAGGDFGKLVQSISNEKKFNLKEMDIDDKRKPDFVGDICTYAFDPNSFDCFVMGEVLEHTHHPFDAINTIHKALKPGGTLLLSSPFIFPIHDHPYDYFRFTEEGYKIMMKDFSSLEITGRNSWAEAIVVLMFRVHNYARSNKLVGILYFIAGVFLWPITKLANALSKDDIMTTGYVIKAIK